MTTMSTAFVYSLAHARVNSQAKAFMSAWTAVIPNSCGMFLIVMQWISHCVQWQIDSVGVFVWALAPFCGFCFVSAFCFAVSAGETQVWLGDLRVVAFGLVVVFVFVASIDLPTPRTFCPCTLYFLLTLM